MSHGILVLAALVAASAAAPRNGLELTAALGRSICPTEVKYNHDKDRIPQVIKTLRCVSQPDDVCASRRNPEECCRRHHPSGVVSECVDIMDEVLVASRDLSKVYSIKVHVGCECIMLGSSTARDTI